MIKNKCEKLIIVRRLSENMMAYLLQFCGMMFSCFTPKFLPFSLAFGTACAFIFMRGVTVLPGIFMGTLGASYLALKIFSAGLVLSGLISIQVALLFWITQRLVSPTLLFYSLKEFFKFIALLVLVLSTTFVLKLFPFFSKSFFWPLFLMASNGILMISVPLIVLDNYLPGANGLTLKKTIAVLGLFFIGFFIFSFFLTIGQYTIFLILLFIAFPIFLGFAENAGILFAVFNFYQLALIILLIHLNPSFLNYYLQHNLLISTLLAISSVLNLLCITLLNKRSYNQQSSQLITE